MWTIVRDLGNGEELIQCSECGFQQIAEDREYPELCPNCGEPMDGDFEDEPEDEEEFPYEPRAIDTTQSHLDLRDEEEVPTVEYPTEPPIYKHWYFWLIIVLSIALLLGGGFVAKKFLFDRIANPPVSTQTDVGGINMTVPSGWASEGNMYVNPGGAATMEVYSHKVSRWLKTEEAADLVYELSGAETNDAMTAKGIKGRLLTKTLESTDENGEPVTTLIERYVFVEDGVFYMVTYKSNEGDAETFDLIISSMSVE